MATTLTIIRGLPASGKTTLAKGMVAPDPARRARVNRDDLRRMLHAGVYLGHETEGTVVEVEDWTIRKLLKAQIDVWCDDTNLSQKRVRQLAEIAVGEGADWRVSDLTDVDVELCVMRDLARADGVGEAVIRGMHERYLKGRTSRRRRGSGGISTGRERRSSSTSSCARQATPGRTRS